MRFGWSVIPKSLYFECKTQVVNDYQRFLAATFNQASYLSQKGALAAFEQQGQLEVNHSINIYLNHASLLKRAFAQLGYEVYGGRHTPYLWVHSPEKPLWKAFDFFLKTKHLIVTPGIALARVEKDFFRVSAFIKKEQLNVVLNRSHLKTITLYL